MKNLIKKNQLMITALAIMIAIAGYLQFAGTNLEDEYLTVNDGDDTSPVDSTGVITENLTAGNVNESYNVDGTLDLSEEDLLNPAVTDIESLDSDGNVIADNYLDENMQVTLPEADGQVAQTDGSAQAQADGSAQAQIDGVGQVAQVQPEEGEIPGEAVFTSTNGVAVLSEAKLLKEQTRAKNKETLLEIINSTGLTDEQKQEAVNNMVTMTEVAEKEAAAEILLEAKGFQDVVVSINGGAADVVVNAVELSDAQRAQIEDIVKRKTDIPAENIIISTVVE